MSSKESKTLIGIQGGVMGWDDPWHYKLCEHFLRTGERQLFKSQDPRPSKEEFIEFIKNIGVDFYLHHVMPDVNEIEEFIDFMEKYELPYMLGNEYGSINRINDGKSNRYDIPESLIAKARTHGKLLGLIYDETEHIQLHPEMYYHDNYNYDNSVALYQWTSPLGKSLEQIENDVSLAVKERAESYGEGVSLFGEYVFPVMMHTFARGGMNPCPKVMKEEFQSLQLSTALGAAKEYNRKLGICVDLWGQDVGEWFTRIWSFPGHSPREYKSALEMSYLMGPEYIFTENIDPLALYKKEGFVKTEFGDILEEFVNKFIPENRGYYNHLMVDPDIVIIRSDDGDISKSGSFFGRGLYGSREIKSNEKSSSVFSVFNLLSRGLIPSNGITMHLPQYDFHNEKYLRSHSDLDKLPLIKGVGKENETSTHGLFYPMNNVVVYDERVTDSGLGNPKLIFLAGSRITPACLDAVSSRVRNGAVCIAAEWLLPEGYKISRADGLGRWIVTRDFLTHAVKEAALPFMGEKGCWMQRFGEYEVRFYNENSDGITLSHEMRKI